MDEKYIGKKIANLRKMKNMSARYLSIELNQSHNYINNIEAFKMLPSIPALYSICEKLNISISDFFKDEHMDEQSEIEILLNNADDETKVLILGILKKILKCS